jgi:hypothetical protein
MSAKVLKELGGLCLFAAVILLALSYQGCRSPDGKAGFSSHGDKGNRIDITVRLSRAQAWGCSLAGGAAAALGVLLLRKGSKPSDE